VSAARTVQPNTSSRAVLTMFDSNAMNDLAALSRDRYQRAGGGGAHKVYNTSKAYYDARGHNEQSAWDRLLVETKHRWRFAADTASEHFRIACLTSQEGFYHGDSIPF
jgi:hypothetical protein